MDFKNKVFEFLNEERKQFFIKKKSGFKNNGELAEWCLTDKFGNVGKHKNKTLAFRNRKEAVDYREENF